MNPQRRNTTKFLTSENSAQYSSSFFLNREEFVEESRLATFADFVKRYSTLSREEFQSSFYHPFLMRISRQDGKKTVGARFTPRGTKLKHESESELHNRLLFFVRCKRRTRNMIRVKVGRIEMNDIYLPHKLVSRFHATLMKAEEDWFVVDEASSNGTFIDGDRLEPGRARMINSGQELSLSSKLSFFFLDASDLFLYLQDFSSR